MIRHRIFLLLGLSLCCSVALAASGFAPSVPDLNLPTEADSSEQPAAAAAAAPSRAGELSVVSVPSTTQQPAAKKKNTNRTNKKTNQTASKASNNGNNDVIAVTDEDFNNDLLMVEKMNPKLPPIQAASVGGTTGQAKARGQQPVAAQTADAAKGAALAAAGAVEGETLPGTPDVAAPIAGENGEDVVLARETTTTEPEQAPKVAYNPTTNRDPTLSPDDVLLLKHREAERLKALEAEKQRKLEAERRRLAELERQRQLELEYLRDPSREVRGKIRVAGIVGQEIFIGDGAQAYGVGDSVLGARIVSIQPDAVVFMYKGQKFTKKVQLQ